MDLVVFEGNIDNSDGARVAGQQECQNKDGGVELGQEGHEAVSDDVSSGENSDDPTYLPSDKEENSMEDIHFTDSDEVYDYESGFGEDNAVPKDCNVEKGKKVVTSDLDDEDAVDGDELEQDHVIGIDADDGEDLAEEGGQRFPVHKTQKEMGKYQWKVGTLYESRQEFKDTVVAYAVNTARNIKFKKCNLVRVRAICQKGCPFWLYAHRVGEEFTWQLRSMNLQHTCMQTHRIGIMHSKWLGSQFKKKVESNPKIKVKELVAKAHKKWNLTVTKAMAAKTKQEAFSQIQGAFREQYKRINDYCHELLRTNPGSTVILKVIRSLDFAQERQNAELMNYCVFQRMYVCFDACKKSFQHCRRFIGLDGCFLKTPQGGQLLTAVGRDPNDQILPIAYAVVEVETKDSWVWFLRHLSDNLGPYNLAKCTFMSDQQKGLLSAFEEVIPGVDNRFCVRHLYSNFRKKFPGLELKNKMWRCAKASHWQSWEKEMKNLRVLNEGAFRHLNGIPPRFWSRSRFTFLSKCDSLVNNMSESFNAVLVEAREKLIVSMLEDIRVYMMTRWAANRERVLNYPENIMPMITKKLEKRASLARDWRPYWSSASNYEVMCGLDKYVVDLAAGECSCRTWQMSGIPCPHAISCITFKGLNLESYVADCYKKEAYIKCYQEVIHPVNDPEL
ncbi:uncharacterized protein LOC110268357 [Arachis ipaensis]|uniref:uncharacterized protein LOC110268357 n=1 Tax=Arachis ipaensis TaxID=130454 RepID=UPI000A2B3187|nr:uncharacterized protein LOC110268357 [Arachis ipaensis]